VKLITIEGDVFRADEIGGICLSVHENKVMVIMGHNVFSAVLPTREAAEAAQLRAVADWKKALE
jgi:hypothetical protein